MHRAFHRLWLILFTGILAFVLSASPLLAKPLAKNYALPNGYFFTEANGKSGAGETGYSTLDSYWGPNLNVRFAAEFQRLGGVQKVGYPASRPFVWDGFTSQVYQKVIFQWHPETNSVAFVNVFDEMHKRGMDDMLYTRYQIPRLADWSGDVGLTWAQIVQRHVAVLQHYPELGLAYYSVPDPVSMYGLPMSQVEDFGPFFVVRMQRASFQQWKIDVPGIATKNMVTIINGGDLAKTVGLVPDWTGVPFGQPTYNNTFVVLEPGRGDTVNTPTMRVVGHGYRLFEAVFSWQVLNSTKSSIVMEGSSKTQTMDGWSRFSFDVDMSSQPNGNYYVRLFARSAADGNPIPATVLDVPFTLQK